jgi:outer membrane lipase/esterase
MGIREGQVYLCQALLIVAIMLGLAPSRTMAQPFSDIFVFGDSLSDTGNIFLATRENIPQSPPYFMGRFSNGPVWVERLAEMLGLEASASLAGGTNFAFGGAETGQETGEIFEQPIDVLIPSIRLQVSTFLASDFIGGPFDDVDPEALYIVWGGPNDLRPAVMAGTTQPAAEAQRAVDDLVAAMRDLADAGARTFLVPNLPDLGLTPESRALGPGTMALATDISIRFNNALAAALNSLESELGITIIRLDVFSALADVVANPAAFGLTNVTDACLMGEPFTGGTACAQPEAHLFWDDIHPTATAHAILADMAFTAIMLPLVVTPAEANPHTSITVSGAAQALPVLQVRLRTGPEMIRLTSVTVAFAEQAGSAALVETMRVNLLHDVNGNGQADVDEPVLATREIPAVVEMLTVDVTPLDISPAAVQHLLVLLDINTAAGSPTATGAALWPFLYPPSGLAWLAGLSPWLGLLFWLRRRPSPLSRGMLVLVLACSLVLSGCELFDDLTDDDDDNNNMFTFTVEIPAQGILAQGAVSGQVATPAVPIAGATLNISP